MTERTNSLLEIEESSSNDRSKLSCGTCGCKEKESSASWLLLFRVFIYNSLFSINFGSFGILYVEYVEYFNASKGAIGWIFTIQICLYSVLGIFVSHPIDKWGCHRVAFFGSLMTSFSLALTSLAPNVIVLYITQGFLMGAGLSATVLPGSVVLQQHFPHNRALANGIAMMGYSFGGLAAPHLIRYLIWQYSWRGGLLILSAVMLNRAPLAMTFWPPKEDKISDDRKSSLCVSMIRHAFDFSLFKKASFTLFCIAGVLQRMYFVASTHHIPSFAVEQGHSLTDAATLGSVQAFGNMVSRLFVTIVANIPGVDRVAMFTIGTLLGAVAITLLLTIGFYSYWGIVAGAAVNGFHMAFTNTVMVVVLVDLLGVEHLSRSLALFHFSIGFFQLFSTPLCGFLFDISGSYLLPFLTIGVMVLLASVFAIASSIVHKRNKKNEQTINNVT